MKERVGENRPFSLMAEGKANRHPEGQRSCLCVFKAGFARQRTGLVKFIG